MNKSKVFIFLFGILFISSLLLVSGAQDSINQTLFDPIKVLFTNWGDGNVSPNIAKILLTVIVGLLIYTVLEKVPFTQGDGSGITTIRIIISAIVAFLSMAFLSTTEIYLILSSYNALGFLLAVAVPFMILLFFSIEMSRNGGAGGRVFSKVIWVAFILFMIYRILSLFWLDIPHRNDWVILGYLIAIVAGIIWILVVEKYFVKILKKEEFLTQREKLEKELAAQDAKRKAEAKSFEGQYLD